MISVDTELSGRDLAAELESLLKKVNQLADSVASLLYKKIGDNWDAGRDPWGAPWTPLAASTIEARRRRNVQGIMPLIDTGKMRSSLKIVKSADGVSLQVEFPAEIHQRGGRSPQRKIFPITAQGEPDLPDSWEKDIEEVTETWLRMLVDQSPSLTR